MIAWLDWASAYLAVALGRALLLGVLIWAVIRLYQWLWEQVLLHYQLTMSTVATVWHRHYRELPPEKPRDYSSPEDWWDRKSE